MIIKETKNIIKAEKEVINECRNKLQELVNADDLFFTTRCSKAIELAVEIAADRLPADKEKFLLIQEEGGWLTYSECAKKNHMSLRYLKMKEGKLCLEDLKKSIDDAEGRAVVLMHSRSGYSFNENMGNISKVIASMNSQNRDKGIFPLTILINDCCGSIGTDSAKFGDLKVCSFGHAKPLSTGVKGAAGGFIAFNSGINSNQSKDDKIKLAHLKAISSNIINFDELRKRIFDLPENLKWWHQKSENIKKELKTNGFSVINSKPEGINVLVQFSDIDEKERLINYCTEQSIEYTECPRYIRTNKKALSLEIKRMHKDV